MESKDESSNASPGKEIALYEKGLSTDNEVVWGEAVACLMMAQTNYIEAGRRFIVLKERLNHGQFVDRLIQYNLEPRRIQELMLVTRKLSNARLSAHLGKKKLITLSRATDEEIQQLEETGSIWGIAQDDLEGMNDKEIRDAYKKEKEKHSKEKTYLEHDLAELRVKNQDLNDEIKIMESGTQTPKAYEDQYRKADNHVMNAVKIINALPDKVLKEDFDLQIKINGLVSSLETLVSHMAFRIRDAINNEAE